jgi:transcriptional regulator of heat shock response
VRRNELALQNENRELLRANQIQQASLSEMQEVLDEYLEGGEFALKSSELALNSAGKFQSAGKKLSRVNASLNEHLALAAIPDTPAELDDDL